MALGDADDRGGRRRRGDEAIVLIDAIGDRPHVVGGRSPEIRTIPGPAPSVAVRLAGRREQRGRASRGARGTGSPGRRATCRCARSSRRARRRGRVSRARRRRGGIQEVVRDIAHVPSLQWCGAEPETASKVCTSSCTATMGQAMLLLRLAGLEEDDCDAGQTAGRDVADAADLEVGRLLLHGAVVVDEVGLLGLDESVLGEQEADRRERGVDLSGPCVSVTLEMSSCRTGSRRRTGERSNRGERVGPASATTRRSLPCRRRSVAPTPPGDRPRREDAIVRRGSRSLTLRPAGDRRRSLRCRTTASASTPRRERPSRTLRPSQVRPRAASHRESTPQRRLRFIARSVQVSRVGSKWPVIAAR